MQRKVKCIEGNLRLKEAISRLIISKKLNANIDLKLYSAILSLHNIHAQNMTLERGKTLNMSDKSMEMVTFKHVICKKLNYRYACRKAQGGCFWLDNCNKMYRKINLPMNPACRLHGVQQTAFLRSRMVRVRGFGRSMNAPYLQNTAHVACTSTRYKAIDCSSFIQTDYDIFIFSH